jgi:hypothetical protein
LISIEDLYEVCMFFEDLQRGMAPHTPMEMKQRDVKGRK